MNHRIWLLLGTLALGCAPQPANIGHMITIVMPPVGAPLTPALAPPAPASAASSDSAGRVVFKFQPRPNSPELVDTMYSMAPSISTGGRYVAMVVTKQGDGDDLYHQDFIVVSTADDRVVERITLFGVEGEDYDTEVVREAVMRGDFDIQAQYRDRADRANAWLSRHTWRELGGTDYDETASEEPRLYTAPSAPNCIIEITSTQYEKPDKVIPPRIVVRRAGRPVVDVVGDSWPHRAPDRDCWTYNTVMSTFVMLDAATGVVAVYLDFRGGHTGCIAPLPIIHTVRTPPGACQ